MEWYEELGRFEITRGMKFKKYYAYAANGEEGVIDHIFSHVKPTSYFCVDVGAGDGIKSSNTRWLVESSWNSLLLDRKGNKDSMDVKIEKMMITTNNVIDVFQLHEVPYDVDFLSIDIDNNDWWILKTILDHGRYRPKLICVEFNPNFKADEDKVRPYWPTAKKNGTIFYGSGISAFDMLGKKYRYKIIHAMRGAGEGGTLAGRNLFLIDDQYVPSSFYIPCSVFHPFAWKEEGKSVEYSGIKRRKLKRYRRRMERGIDVSRHKIKSNVIEKEDFLNAHQILDIKVS